MKMPWQSIWLACIGALLAAMLCGCINPPTFHNTHLPAVGSVTPSVAGSQSAQVPTSVKDVVHGQAVLFSILGIVLFLGGVALCYFQFYIPAVKLFIAGVALPVVGIVWSEHYAIIIAVSLVALAIWYMLTHQAGVSAIIQEIGPDADEMLASIKGLAGIAATKPATAPAPQQTANTAKPL